MPKANNHISHNVRKNDAVSVEQCKLNDDVTEFRKKDERKKERKPHNIDCAIWKNDNYLSCLGQRQWFVVCVYDWSQNVMNIPIVKYIK